MINDLQAIIDRIIAEHRVLLQQMEQVDKVANDAQALMVFDKAKDDFMPSRIHSSEDGLKDFDRLFGKVDTGLRNHFHFEETALLGAFQSYGRIELASALYDLLLQHHELRDRLTTSRLDLERLLHGGLDRHSWEASAYDLRTHVTHTRSLLEKHAREEQEMLLGLKNKIEGGK